LNLAEIVLPLNSTKNIVQVEKRFSAKAQAEAESNFWDYGAERQLAVVRAEKEAEEMRRDGGKARAAHGWLMHGGTKPTTDSSSGRYVYIGRPPMPIFYSLFSNIKYCVPFHNVFSQYTVQ
jgi:hypothetical protein